METPDDTAPRLPYLVKIYDRQKTRRIKLAVLEQLARSLLGALPPVRGQAAPGKFVPPGGQLAVYLIKAGAMAALNEEFLGHAGSTDVLTFNYQARPGEGAISAEIFISTEDVATNARRFQTTWQLELARCLAHGVLHLRGYDDQEPAAAREMKRWETRLLNELAGRFDLGQLDRAKNAARRK